MIKIDDIIPLIISIAIPLGLGYNLVRIITDKEHLGTFFSLSLGFGLGLGVLSLWMFLLNISPLPLNIRNIGIPLLWTLLGLSFLNFKQKTKKKSSIPKISSKQDKESLASRLLSYLGILYISYIIFFVFWHSLNIPIKTYDALVFISYKAKIIFYEGNLALIRNTPQPSYPLLTEFSESWVALNLNRWDEILVKIIFPFTFISYAGIHYYFLKHFTNKRWAIGGICLLFSSNFLIYHATIEYRDLIMMYYNCSAILLLLLWRETQHRPFLILSALFSGLMSFVKLEGSTYCFLHFLLLLIFILEKPKTSNKILTISLFILPAFILNCFFPLYRQALNIPLAPEKTKIDLSFIFLNRFFITSIKFLENILYSSDWNIIWLVLFISIILHFRKIFTSRAIKNIFLSLLIYFFFYFLLSSATNAFCYLGGHLSDLAISRIILHFFPLSVLLIVFLNFSEPKN